MNVLLLNWLWVLFWWLFPYFFFVENFDSVPFSNRLILFLWVIGINIPTKTERIINGADVWLKIKNTINGKQMEAVIEARETYLNVMSIRIKIAITINTSDG